FRAGENAEKNPFYVGHKHQSEIHGTGLAHRGSLLAFPGQKGLSAPPAGPFHCQIQWGLGGMPMARGKPAPLAYPQFLRVLARLLAEATLEKPWRCPSKTGGPDNPFWSMDSTNAIIYIND